MHLDSWKSPLDLLAGWHLLLQGHRGAGLQELEAQDLGYC